MTITIKQIITETKLSQRTGKNYESCRILTTNSQGQDTWLSGFGSAITKTWEAGDVVDIDLSQNAKGYWDFKENGNSKPSPDKKLALLEKIDRKLDLLLGSGMNGQVLSEKAPQGQTSGNAVDMNVTQEDIDSLPF